MHFQVRDSLNGVIGMEWRGQRRVPRKLGSNGPQDRSGRHVTLRLPDISRRRVVHGTVPNCRTRLKSRAFPPLRPELAV